MAAVSPRRPEGGAQIELLVVPQASVVPIPEGATLAQAATLPMNGLTAKLGLELLGLGADQTLGVTGGAGLLGSYVVALAKELGVRVIADAKPEDETLVRQLASDGRLQLRVAGEYPPEQAADAQQIMDAGGLRGRVLIVF
jgi:NADPH:quinone reductase-like Zn-dependent oxidoreductase